MRLIDADALMKDARRLIDTYAEDGHEHYTHINAIEVAAVNASPTIEAEPVQHGRWQKAWDYSQCRYYHQCSECGWDAIVKAGSMYTEVLNYYCPHCGAKMDAKED